MYKIATEYNVFSSVTSYTRTPIPDTAAMDVVVLTFACGHERQEFMPPTKPVAKRYKCNKCSCAKGDASREA